jgi:predicted nucleic acid-binding protein
MGSPDIRHLIDTNVWIDALAGRLSRAVFIKLSLETAWTGFSAITRLELFGFPRLTDVQEKKLLELLEPFEEVAVDSRIIDRAIGIRKTGRIKVPDAIIASTALENNSVLVTHNLADFKDIVGLKILDPHSLLPTTKEDAGVPGS